MFGKVKNEQEKRTEEIRMNESSERRERERERKRERGRENFQKLEKEKKNVKEVLAIFFNKKEKIAKRG